MDRRVHLGLIAILLTATAGCETNAPARDPSPKTSLQIGIGGGASATAGDENGLNAIISNMIGESLVALDNDGRPRPSLVERWEFSSDGLSLGLRLRDALFHDGTPVTADIVKSVLDTRLPRTLGPSYDEVTDVRVDSPRELTLQLRKRNNFVVDALNTSILKPGSRTNGTGPFSVTSAVSPITFVANPDYPAGAPGISSLQMKRYDSVRAAWAELLRGNVDMLYEVGADALDSLEPSSKVRVFSFRRHYQLVGTFNLRSAVLRDPAMRRSLTSALDRSKIIEEALAGRAGSSSGPIWPEHWAAPTGLAPIAYAPKRLVPEGQSITLRCLVGDTTYERTAIAIQRQLQSVGVHLELLMPDAEAAMKAFESGDFDIALIEVASAPNLLRPYLFWSSKGPYNYGGYSSAPVDAAFDAIRQAVDDDAYRKGVADLQRAIADDPPAMFIAWTERARAVSTAFQVPVEPGRDPLATLRLWKPVGATAPAN